MCIDLRVWHWLRVVAPTVYFAWSVVWVVCMYCLIWGGFCFDREVF